MSFHDSLFPLDIAYNSEGGPQRRTEIITLQSGFEERNSPWAGSRRSYNAGYGVKSLKDIETVIAFFEARHGRLYSFRFRDPFDHKSCSIGQKISGMDQVIGVGDGLQFNFQLKKIYSDGYGTYEREIRKPELSSLIITIDEVIQNLKTDYEIDSQSGLIHFTNPPELGARIQAGYIFDTIVRFDTDQLQISLSDFQAGDIPNIPLIEVLS